MEDVARPASEPEEGVGGMPGAALGTRCGHMNVVEQ